MLLRYIALAIGSYLLGSIPFGFIVAKKLKGIDIRDHGSGNIGATNIMRVIGPVPAAAVFIADILKGFIPVMAAKIWIQPPSDLFIIGCGVIAIIGHTLSVFLNFKGGKGVATGLGVIIGLNPLIAAIAFGIWIVVLAISRYVSLASMVASLSVPIMMMYLQSSWTFTIFTAIIAIYIIIKHRENIVRIINGNESKIGEKVEL